MPRIRVLKPFMFTHSPSGQRGLSRETQFQVNKDGTPREYEISEEIWNHPWICDDLADGKIESHAQAALRTAAEAKKADELAAEARASNARAEAAMSRAQVAYTHQKAATNADEELLNTPVNKLSKIDSGTGIGKGVSGGSDADVPVDKLRARQNQK